MSKKIQKVKFIGSAPSGLILTAKIADPVTGKKVGLTHRSSVLVSTGTSIKAPDGYKLCFSLVAEFSKRGLVATNAPGNFQAGEIKAHLLNCGKEIIEIRDGDSLLNVWLEQIHEFEWEIDS